MQAWFILPAAKGISPASPRVKAGLGQSFRSFKSKQNGNVALFFGLE